MLGILYEDLVHPLTILSTLPSAGLGALLILHATGTELSLIALIGIILLIGIVKKNGIMLVDFALDAERTQGLSGEEAIRHACHDRFRPILMTTLAAMLGALPLILATGPGSELRIPLGLTIIGGLAVSQVLTIYTTPVIYLFLDKLRRKRGPLVEGPRADPGLTPRRSAARLPLPWGEGWGEGVCPIGCSMPVQDRRMSRGASPGSLQPLTRRADAWHPLPIGEGKKPRRIPDASRPRPRVPEMQLFRSGGIKSARARVRLTLSQSSST